MRGLLAIAGVANTIPTANTATARSRALNFRLALCPFLSRLTWLPHFD